MNPSALALLIQFGPKVLLAAYHLLTDAQLRAAVADIKTRSAADPQFARDLLAIIGEVQAEFAAAQAAHAPG